MRCYLIMIRMAINRLEKGKATHCSILAWRIPRTV